MRRTILMDILLFSNNSGKIEKQENMTSDSGNQRAGEEG